MKVGVNGAVRDISDLKVGVSGAVRAVSEAYIGVAGATKKVWPNKKALNDCTWDEISEISSSGKAASMFKVGDRKEIVLNGTMSKLTFNDYHTYAFIIGFDHNASREGSNRIHFQLAKTALSGGKDICLVSGFNNDSDFYMNTWMTNSGGWEDSYMRNNILGTSKTSYSGRFIGVLPSALRNVLKSVTKYTDNTGGGSTSSGAVTATTDYAFCSQNTRFSAVAHLPTATRRADSSSTPTMPRVTARLSTITEARTAPSSGGFARLTAATPLTSLM